MRIFVYLEMVWPWTLQHAPTLTEVLKMFKTCWSIRACRHTCQSEEEEGLPPPPQLPRGALLQVPFCS